MLKPARLITPQGKAIELTPEIYRQVKELLTDRTKDWSAAGIDQAIRATYGKYAGGDSLTQALLIERSAERAREDAKVTRGHG